MECGQDNFGSQSVLDRNGRRSQLDQFQQTPTVRSEPFHSDLCGGARVGRFWHEGTSQSHRIAARKAKALDWLRHTSPKDTEDRVFRLLALDRLEASKEATQTAAKQLVAKQRADGGWAQTADLESDAYATGSALFSLHQTGELSVDDSVYRRGLQFLLRDQQEDGSWRVKSRSKPFQKHFESGYPHGKDQFISITAASWATLAMLFALPERERVKDESP